MNTLLRKLDLTVIAYVAAMAVLLSTMFLLLMVPLSTFAQGDAGDGDGDGDWSGGDGGTALVSYIEANIKQIEVKTLTSEICREYGARGAGGVDAANCVGVIYYVTLHSAIQPVGFIRTDSMSLSEFYNQIRASGFTGEMSMMMQIINKIGKTVGVYAIAHTTTGFTVNGESGDTTDEDEDEDGDDVYDYDEDYWDDIDTLYDNFLNDDNQVLLDTLAELLERLAELQRRLAELRGDGDGDPVPPGGPKPWCSANALARDLQLGDEGEDVRILQKFLNAQPGIRIAESGPGSPGFESTFFGFGTQRALIKFQEMHPEELLRPVGEQQGTGYFGALTKSFIKKQCQPEVVTSFKLSDVKKVTVQVVDVNDNELEKYTITLKSGKVVTVSITDRMSDLAVVNAFRSVGYTGDVDDLMDMAEEEDGDTLTSFDIDDVKTVTYKSVDPIPDAADDEYVLWTIILNDGDVIEIEYNAMEAGGYQNNDDYWHYLLKREGYVFDGDFEDLKDVAEEEEVVSFGLSAIEKVTVTVQDTNDLVYRVYKITLKNGKIVTVMHKANLAAWQIREIFREAGYTGSMSALLDMAEEVDDEAFSYSLSDIKKVTSKVDGSSVDDSEHTLYTVTLKNGQVIEFKVSTFTYPGAFEIELRKSGYTGDVDDFLDLVEVVESNGGNLMLKPWIWIITSGPVPKASDFIVTFKSDGTLSSKTDCNDIYADYEVNGDRISIENISIGKPNAAIMSCLNSREGEFVEILEDAESYSIREVAAVNGWELRIELSTGEAEIFR